MQTTNERISVKDGSDPYGRDKCLGDLSERQFRDLETAVRRSPVNYSFTVIRYDGGPSSSATHVSVYDGEVEVGLVGLDCCQYYDKNKQTEAVVRRVSQLVYRKSVHFV